MASVRKQATSGGRDSLPKRFRPFYDQALTQSALRYGSQQSALASILGQVTRDYGRQQQAQTTAGASLMGALSQADNNLQRTYTDAGLTPSLLSQIGNSPTGQRLAGELASNRAAVQQQMTGAQAGQQFLHDRLADQYREDVGKISDQNVALNTERGLYTSSLLDQLIQGDRASRHEANALARKQQHDDLQQQLDREAAQGNALIGQGLVVGEDGTLTPLPGGKADPNAPKNKPKRTTGPGTASPEAQRDAGTDFKKAVGIAKGLVGGKAATPEIRQATTGILTNGKPAVQGKVVYEDVPALDSRGQPIPNKTKRQAKIDPATGQQVTGPSRPAVPAFDAPIAAAATEQAMFGYVTTETVRELQKLGYSVNQIPGLKTENQYRQSRPKSPTTQRTRPKNTGSIRDIYG